MALVPRTTGHIYWYDINRMEHFRKLSMCNDDLCRLPLRDRVRPWRTNNLEHEIGGWPTMLCSLNMGTQCASPTPAPLHRRANVHVTGQIGSDRGAESHSREEEEEDQVIVDVQQFTPEEITVRTDDKSITVEAKH